MTTLTYQKKQEREKLASQTPNQKSSMEGMIAMVGMSGMIGMMAKKESETAKDCLGDNCDKEFAGTFKVTSRGEIILSPAQNDLRLISGLRGRFKMTKSGGLELFLNNNLSSNKDDKK